jgi:hypothetical protein
MNFSFASLKWHQKFFLWFLPKQYSTEENYMMIYKIWRGKIYIISQYPMPVKHYNCRCAIGLIEDYE